MADFAVRSMDTGMTMSFHCAVAKTFALQAAPSFSTSVRCMTEGAVRPLMRTRTDFAAAMAGPRSEILSPMNSDALKSSGIPFAGLTIGYAVDPGRLPSTAFPVRFCHSPLRETERLAVSRAGSNRTSSGLGFLRRRRWR